MNRKLKMTSKQIGTAAFAAIFVFFGLSAMLGSWYIVDQGERGVVLRNGKFVSTSDPGLHWKMPLMDDVHKLSVQSRLASYTEMSTYSRDQQPATMAVCFNYHIESSFVQDVYSNYGSEQAMIDRLITPRVMAETKNVFGRFNAVEAIQQRERLNLEVQEALQQVVQGSVMIESIQVENIDFSKAYEDSVEQRMLAEVEVQKIRQNLERERVQAEIITTQAQAAADAVVLAANAEADAIRVKGLAEADAITARGDALNDNPNLVQLVQAERWNGQLPSTMIPSGSVPILQMK
jgi:regulator of protease activity HflC (stomatin/prohibitin superfamily)